VGHLVRSVADQNIDAPELPDSGIDQIPAGLRL
jgi:hypothetical protein